MSLSLGMGGADTASLAAGVTAPAGTTATGVAGAIPAVPEEALQGLTPVEAGKTIINQVQSTFDEVKGKAKQAISTDNIGSVEASTQAAAAGIQNPDRATVDAVRGAFKGMTDLAGAGAKNLVGDAAGFLAGGGAPPPGHLEKSLEGGFQNLMTFMAPQVPVKQAMDMAKGLGQTK